MISKNCKFCRCLFFFILGAKHEENKTDGVKNLADQEHLSEENLFYIMVALKNAW